MKYTFQKVPKLQYLCQLTISSTINTLIKQNEQKGALISKQQKQINDLKTENSLLKKNCDSKNAVIPKQKKQKNLLKNSNESLRAGTFPKTTKTKVVHNVLSGKFTSS